MRRRIDNARMVVTGASQGIGKALAEEAVRRGARVLAVARSRELLEELKGSLAGERGRIEVVPADITSPQDRQKLLAAADELGGLDVLINNAGIGATGHLVEASPERLRRIMEVNFFGLTETTRLLLPRLRQGERPAIVNISSIAGRRGIPARSEYSASKFAVQGFTEALRCELAGQVDVLLVNPGLTQTNFSRNMLEQKARLQFDHYRGMTAEEVARRTLDALARGRRELTLTLQGKLIVFFSRFFPRLADHVTARKVREAFQDELAQRRKPRHLPAQADRLSR
jgi:short-subunit dehydrogenase